ncbi:hypothetical protein JTB14_021214 [Gonioctena quinquepunctata]|nr:hypothetical protein JTB14_021214 [Gonioctena quinquepunctata]
MRWSLALPEYTFTIQYRTGKKHANVDTLSRVKPIGYLGTEPTLEPIWNRERIRRSQQDDPAFQNIIGNILNDNSRDYYLDLDRAVYRKSEDSRHGDLLALLPKIMKAYHDLPISGHTGYDKTYARIDMNNPFDGIFEPLQVRYDADSDNIAEFMQRMKIAHRNAIQTIEATTDRVHGQFNTKAKEPGFAFGDRVYLYQPAIQAGLTSKLTKKWIGP